MRSVFAGSAFLAVLAGASTVGCGEAPRAQAQASSAPATAWTLDFPTSATGPAQEHFLRGLTAMHLFMYPDAVKAFRAAQEADPGFAMAYWGEALTHYRPIWREYERDEARAVLQRLGPTAEARAAKAPTDREKAYLATLDVLYADGEPPVRLRAYAGALEALVAKYPDDTEALALWALSRVVQYARTDAEMQERMRTAGIAQEVLRRSPRHLGAARYLIQSVDDPVHADLGVIAAQIFIDAAPDSSEARHMPTHISAQLGRWKEMADLNWQAFEISMDWTKRNGYKLQDLNNHNYGHLLTYAQYGYLQLGQYERARQIIDRARADFQASNQAPEIANTLAGTIAQYLVETHDREQLAALRDLTDSGAGRGANVHYAIGLVSAKTGDLARAKSSLAALRGTSADMSIMQSQVAALIAAAEGDERKALTLMTVAAAQETAQIYSYFGPPGPYKPAHELLGELLLAANRPADALKAFQESLRIFRRRTASLLGASRAAAAAGDAALAQDYAARLLDIWRDADRSLPTLEELRRTTQ
jgi:tetratricopeptide (TPR) repeat protein